MKTYKIITFDGGGVRGVISAAILANISSHLKTEQWIDSSQLFAGTSIGGILALALAKGLSSGELLTWLCNGAPSIFKRSLMNRLFNPGRLFYRGYSNKSLHDELVNCFGENLTLGELNKKVVIPTFNLDYDYQGSHSWQPKIFHNFKGKGDDCNFSVVKAALYTSAAPTYFPSVDGYVDGGVCVNNPSMCAIAQLFDSRNIEKRDNLKGIKLISIGTGHKSDYIKRKKVNYGVIRWGSKLISMLMDGPEGIADYQSASLLGPDNYCRIDIPIPDSFLIDSPKVIPKMVQAVNSYNFKKEISWIQNNW